MGEGGKAKEGTQHSQPLNFEYNLFLTWTVDWIQSFGQTAINFSETKIRD